MKQEDPSKGLLRSLGSLLCGTPSKLPTSGTHKGAHCQPQGPYELKSGGTVQESLQALRHWLQHTNCTFASADSSKLRWILHEEA